MTHEVIKQFRDLKDGRRLYRVGDIYPRAGLTPTKTRISELSGKKNKLGVPLIKELKEEKPAPKKAAEEAVEEPIKEE